MSSYVPGAVRCRVYGKRSQRVMHMADSRQKSRQRIQGWRRWLERDSQPDKGRICQQTAAARVLDLTNESMTRAGEGA